MRSRWRNRPRSNIKAAITLSVVADRPIAVSCTENPEADIGARSRPVALRVSAETFRQRRCTAKSGQSNPTRKSRPSVACGARNFAQ